MPFVPYFLLHDLIGWLLAVAMLAVLAAFFPAELGQKADLFAPAPAGIKPEWYFLFMFQTLKMIPAKVLHMDGELLGIMIFNLAGVLWVLLPFFDKEGNQRRARWILGVVVFALSYIVAMTIYGHFAK